MTGSMRPELHGEVPENEPTDIAALPGVPDGRQRECHRNGPEERTNGLRRAAACKIPRMLSPKDESDGL